MEKYINRLNIFFEHLPDNLRKKKFLVVSLIVLITVFLGIGGDKIVMDESIDSLFKENNPVKKEYDKFKTVFGGDEYIYLVYKAKDGDIFSDKSVKALKGLYDDLANYRLKLKPSEKSPLDHIVEIKSLINIKFLESSNDVLYSKSFIGDNLPANDHEREILRKKALNNPDFSYLFLSENSGYGGMLLKTDFNSELLFENSDIQTKKKESVFDDDDDDDDSDEDDEIDDYKEFSATPVYSEDLKFKKTDLAEYPVLMDALRKIMEKDEYSNALSFHPVGIPVMNDFLRLPFLRILKK